MAILVLVGGSLHHLPAAAVARPATDYRRRFRLQ